MELLLLEVLVAIVVDALSPSLAAALLRARLEARQVAAARRTKLGLPATSADEECTAEEGLRRRAGRVVRCTSPGAASGGGGGG